MTNQNIKGTARVTVILEIDVQSVWGGDCLVEQIYNQAASGVRETVRKMIQESKQPIRLIGDPDVCAIITRRNDGAVQ